MESINGGPGQLETLSHEPLSFLSEGISSVLSRWPAFQMAIEKEWGGRDSRQKSVRLVSDLVSWFSQSRVPHHIADLENILDECMVLSFNTDIEDGSIEEIHSKRRNRLEQKRLNALVFVKYDLQLEQRELSRRGDNRNMDPICLSDMESDDEWITETEDPTLPLVEDAWVGVSECFATQDLEATPKKPRKKSQGPQNTQIGASQSAKGKGKAVVEEDEYGYSSEEGLEDDEEEEEERGDIDEEEKMKIED